MRRVAPGALLLVLALQAVAAEPPWRFVVLGDTRDATTNTATGISPDLPALAAAVAAERPDLVLHTGDLTNGYYTSSRSPMNGRYREMLRNWKGAMAPLAGVPVYPVRGNHEDGKLVTNEALVAAYREEIANALPQDGPDGEKGFTYTVAHKGARFLLLDGYREKRLGVIRGYVNQAWVDAALARAVRPFTFVVSHTPAFRVGRSGNAPFPDVYSHGGARDRLWESLRRAGAQAYFCGHIHFYCRGTVRGIEQVVVGNGGANPAEFEKAKVDPEIALRYPLATSLPREAVRTGYVVVTVDEEAGTASAVLKLRDRTTGAWEPAESFVLSAAR